MCDNLHDKFEKESADEQFDWAIGVLGADLIGSILFENLTAKRIIHEVFKNSTLKEKVIDHYISIKSEKPEG